MYYKFFLEQALPFRNLMVLEGIFFLMSLLALAQPEVLRRATDSIRRGDGEGLKRTLLFAAVTAAVDFR